MSSNVLESFLVELGFKNSGALEGIQQTQSELDKTAKAAKQTGASMEQSGAQGAMFFRQIRNEALLMLSLFTGGYGIKTFVSNTIEELSKLGYTAENMDMAPERLTEWGQAAEKAGGSAQSMTAMLAKANQDIAATHAGSARLYSQLSQGEGVLNFFSQGGLNPADMKNGEELLLNYADVLHKVYEEQGGAAAITLAQTMGVDAESFNFLKQGREAVLLQIAAMEKYAIKNKENTENAQLLKGKLSDLGSEFNSLGTRIALQFFPVVDWLAEKLKKFGDYLINNKEAIAKTFNTWAENIKSFAAKVDGVAQSMGGWQTIIEALITLKIGAWIANLLAMAAAFLKVGAGLTAINAAATGGGLAAIAKIAGVAGLFLYSEGLNKGEDEINKQHEEELKKSPKAFDQSAYKTDKGAYILNKLQSKGLTREESLGLIANWQMESNLNPDQKQIGGGPGYGLAQWEGPRQKNFEKMFHKSIVGSTLDEQIDFAIHEITQGEEKANWKKVVEGAKGQGAAGIASGYSKLVERPANAEKDAANRAIVAQELEKVYSSEYIQNMQKAIPNTISEKRGNVATNNNTTSDTKVNIVVNAKSNDPKGIANETKKAFSNAGSLTFQANTGLTA
jgi:hypothetical protein